MNLLSVTYRVSPMAGRPDTPAKLAVEERGMRAILAACSDPLLTYATIRAELWPANYGVHPTVHAYTTIQN